MKRALVLGLALAATPLLAGATDPGVEPSASPMVCGQKSAISASTSTETRTPVMIPGYGTGGFSVATASPVAQGWFNEGMRLAHAFAHKPSIAAFKQAVKADPDCAMCNWGQAWASGQTINFGIDDKTRKENAALAKKAVDLSRTGPELERRLAAALVLRYGDNAKGAADLAFAKAMDALATERPNDTEVAVITADAWLIMFGNDNDKTHVNRSLALLEAGLKQAPEDTGLIHFYIHATEMYGEAAKALPYARKLGLLAPGASHLVHMPSHTFYRVGLYGDAAVVNDQAAALDARTMKLRLTPGKLFGLDYHIHNVHFGLGGAMMAGDSVRALSFADQFRGHFSEIETDHSFDQLASSTAFYAYGRFADPAMMLGMPQPAEKFSYMRAMWRYGRGEALARKGDAAGVRAEARAMQYGDLSAYKDHRKMAVGLIEIARNVLLGRAAMLEGKPRDAALAYGKAAKLQREVLDPADADPPLWWYPVDRSLAAAQLASGDYTAALATTTASLKVFPEDALTLTVAARAARGMGKETDAAAFMARARKVWTGDPGEISLSEM